MGRYHRAEQPQRQEEEQNPQFPKALNLSYVNKPQQAKQIPASFTPGQAQQPFQEPQKPVTFKGQKLLPPDQ